jgi:hypothetical protein
LPTFDVLLKKTFSWHGLPIQFHRFDDPAVAKVVNQFEALHDIYDTLKWFTKKERERVLVGEIVINGEHIYALFNFNKNRKPTQPQRRRWTFYLVMFSYGETACWGDSPMGRMLLGAIKKHIKPRVYVLLH